MSIIKLPLRFEGAKGEKVLYALFDSGANLSCINEEFAKEIANLQRLYRTRQFESSTITHAICADFFIDNIHLSDEFFVVANLKQDVIIALPTLRKWRIKLDFETDQVIVDPKVAKLQLI